MSILNKGAKTSYFFGNKGIIIKLNGFHSAIQTIEKLQKSISAISGVVFVGNVCVGELQYT